MDRMKKRVSGFKRRARRTRAKLFGTAERPRLSVSRSNLHMYAQVIDDVTGTTLVSASTLDKEFKADHERGNTVAAAQAVGELVGKRAVSAGISEVVFDRGGRIYHGRVKALADGARQAGLKF